MTAANSRQASRKPKSGGSFSDNVPPGLHCLPPLDPKSEEFLDLFRSFLSSKDERSSILALSGEDARVFMEIIDRAFRAAKMETELRQIALGVLEKLCGKEGHLPGSYLLSDEFDLSGLPLASSGFADVRLGVFKGKNVAVKSLIISEQDNKAKIRKYFCKAVAIWKNLSHPNVLDLIGAPDTLDDGRFSMVSEWVAHGNIMEFVRKNAGNHLKLLADAVEGLRYLHNTNTVHGDLKGANILIKNTNPLTACLADFGFMTIVYDPGLGMEAANCEIGGGTTPFMAPELLLPSKFGLYKCIPSKEADIYAIGMVIYQVLTGTLPFGKLSGSEVVFKVVEGGKPSKPANAPELGISDKVWKLLEDCWQTERTLRPSIKGVLGRVKAAALSCSMLSPVGGVPQPYEAPLSAFDKWDQLFLGTTFPEDEDNGRPPEVDRIISLLRSKGGSKQPLHLERDQAQGYADILDAFLDERTMFSKTRTQYLKCLKCLRTLCVASGILPSSFTLADAFDGQGATLFARGGYGCVSQMTFGGRHFAVKTLFTTNETEGLQKKHRLLVREVVGWKWLRHENILPFVGVTPKLAIVSDFMENGNIMGFIANHPHHNRLHLLMGAAYGLEYLHSHNIVHGDLKGANVLIDSGNSARLADFGLTTIIDDSTVGSTTGGRGLQGTARWMAPELLQPERFGFPDRKRLPSKGTDVYALGMTILEVLTRKQPFGGIRNTVEVLFEVAGGKKPDRPLSVFSDTLWGLLLKAWDPEFGSQPPTGKRPSIQTILNQLKEDADNWDQFIAPVLGLQVELEESCEYSAHSTTR